MLYVGDLAYEFPFGGCKHGESIAKTGEFEGFLLDFLGVPDELPYGKPTVCDGTSPFFTI